MKILLFICVFLVGCDCDPKPIQEPVSISITDSDGVTVRLESPGEKYRRLKNEWHLAMARVSDRDDWLEHNDAERVYLDRLQEMKWEEMRTAEDALDDIP